LITFFFISQLSRNLLRTRPPFHFAIMMMPLEGRFGKVHVASRAVCTAANLHSVKDAQWDAPMIKQFILRFERDFVIRITDPVYWHQNPWDGLFDGIRHRLAYNYARSARKKTTGYYEMLRRRADLGPLACQNPTAPCLVWGQPNHSLALPRQDIELYDPQCCWWPAIVGPWVPCGRSGLCLYVLCADNAVTASRPWEVHRDRIFIITDDVANADHPLRSGRGPATMPAADPTTTSTVEIVEVASDVEGSVCSDLVHVAIEQELSFGTSSNAVSDAVSDVSVSDFVVVTPTALNNWELVD
jgi:hypothetical protein